MLPSCRDCTPVGHNEGVDIDAFLSALSKLAPEARTILVALSGGGDSVALLRLLGAGPQQLHAAHFDHALRPGSGADARFVAELCRACGVPLQTERAEVRAISAAKGWNLEDGARRLRYSFLARAAKRAGADVIVTAHTQDDQAETVLLQLLRGAAYLRGMPARRGAIVRPVLSVSRAALRAYLQDLGQTWLEDESNRDSARARAWLRLDVIPELEARYPALKTTLARLAGLQRDAVDDLETRARHFIRDSVIDASALAAHPPALQRTALKLLLEDGGSVPDALHLEQLRAALGAPAPFRLALPGDKLARLAYGQLEVIAAQSATPTAVTPTLELPAEVDPEKLAEFPLRFYRTRAPGDRIRLAGGSKKLSDLLIDAKVPRERRDSVRLLASAPRGPAEVLWVEGIATDVRVARTSTAAITDLITERDAEFMATALRYAKAAAAAGEVPIGAVVVTGDVILAAAANTTRAACDPSAHAEVNVLRDAAKQRGDWRLSDCTLYVTLEPCPMCFGAMLAAHVPRLVYGATNRRDGALGGVFDLRQHAWKRGLSVRGGVRAEQAEQLLSEFFGSRRGKAETDDIP